jgi:uncharacterized protein with HEPN domain
MSKLVKICQILTVIEEAAKRINRRFINIKSPEDFTASDEGIDRLDAICMMLIAIGENLKQLDKLTNGELLEQYPQVDWQGAKGIRDIISHHYFQVDTEIIFDVCQTKISGLILTINLIQEDLKNGPI